MSNETDRRDDRLDRLTRNVLIWLIYCAISLGGLLAAFLFSVASIFAVKCLVWVWRM